MGSKASKLSTSSPSKPSTSSPPPTNDVIDLMDPRSPALHRTPIRDTVGVVRSNPALLQPAGPNEDLLSCPLSPLEVLELSPGDKPIREEECVPLRMDEKVFQKTAPVSPVIFRGSNRGGLDAKARRVIRRDTRSGKTVGYGTHLAKPVEEIFRDATPVASEKHLSSFDENMSPLALNYIKTPAKNELYSPKIESPGAFNNRSRFALGNISNQ